MDKIDRTFASVFNWLGRNQYNAIVLVAILFIAVALLFSQQSELTIPEQSETLKWHDPALVNPNDFLPHEWKEIPQAFSLCWELTDYDKDTVFAAPPVCEQWKYVTMKLCLKHGEVRLEVLEDTIELK